MMIRPLDSLLKEHIFFKGIKPKHLKTIVGCASNVRFNKDQLIFREGKPAKKFYIIRKGKVSLELATPDKGCVCLLTVGENEVLGWSWLFPPYRWFFTARALETTVATALDGECLRKKCNRDQALGYDLMKRFTQIIIRRLRAAQIQLLDICGGAH